MAYITAANTARKIASQDADGRGLTVYLSEHADKRITDRLTYVAPAGTDMDKWAVAGLVAALRAKEFGKTAPLDYYDDGVKREDDNCFYAVAELRPGFPVCIVFAAQGREVIIVTVLWPLDKGGAREVRQYGEKGARERQVQRTQQIGGRGRRPRAA